MPHGCNNDNNFINMPTIFHEPAVFQSAYRCSNIQFADSEAIKLSCDASEQNPVLRLPNQSNNQNSLIMTMKNISYEMRFLEKHVTRVSTCKSTNSISVTSPYIYSGGCLIQNMETGILVQAPSTELQQKLTDDSCLMQKKPLPTENEHLIIFNKTKNFDHRTFVTPPSGCLDLPGSRKILPSFKTMKQNNKIMDAKSRQQKISIVTNDCCNCNCDTIRQNLCQFRETLTDTSTFDDCDSSLLFESLDNGMQIQMNANVQPNMNCRINITATTAMPCSQIMTMKLRTGNKLEQHEEINWKETKEREKQKKEEEEKKKKEDAAVLSTTTTTTTTTCYVDDFLVSRGYANDNDNFINVPTIVYEPADFQSTHCCSTQLTGSKTAELSNNFNENAIVQPNNLYCTTKNRIIATENSNGCNNNEQKDGAPNISISHPWVTSNSWNLGTKLFNKDIRLREIRRQLQICGWYHENISWKQSENLLKDTSVGRWLMRDSSDSRYIFAISVQTARGPTSVRVCYFLKHFQFDAEPELALAIPTFDCPITMLEHYVEYSKKMDRREVLVDYSGQLYSQIYLTEPLIKEIKSLSHLARLVVNRNKLPTEHLPLLIKNYLAEYPYTL